jgi:hypothetical protein
VLEPSRRGGIMNTTVPRGAVVVLLVLFAACGGSGPTFPTGTTPPLITPPPPPPPPPSPQIDFPPLTGPSRTFIFDRELSYPVRDYTQKSRFVLYANGAFELQYPPSQYGPGLYRGAYRDANGVVMFLFEFQGRRVGTPWNDATGTLSRDSLTVQYAESMQHADFENAVYVLMP